MMDPAGRPHRSILRGIAHRAMLERGVVPDCPLQALAEFDAIHGPAMRTEESTRNLRSLFWCSIDNDDSRDLDQSVRRGIAVVESIQISRNFRNVFIAPTKP
jgi:hypothetical protein